MFGEHLPLLDLDGDRHSTIRELRGFSWRGKDCDDGRGDIYPGRASSNYGPEIDHDCNGIYGINVRLSASEAISFDVSISRK